MTAPRRWKDTPDAPVGVRELLSAGRAPRALDGAAFDRGAARVAKLGAAPVAAAAAGAAVGMWTKLAAAAVIGVASVGAVVAVKQVAAPGEAETRAAGEAKANAEAEAKAKAAAEAKAAAAAEAKAAAEAEAKAKAAAEAKAEANAEAEAEAAAKARPMTAVDARAVGHAGPPGVAEAATAVEPPPAIVAPVPAATIGDELALLEQARGALARDPGTALARLAEHRARFPAGALGAERDLIELDALRRSGRTAEARARAGAWLRREPEGLHAARVRAIQQSLEPRE